MEKFFAVIKLFVVCAAAKRKAREGKTFLVNTIKLTTVRSFNHQAISARRLKAKMRIVGLEDGSGIEWKAEKLFTFSVVFSRFHSAA